MLNWLRAKLKRKVKGILIGWIVYKPGEPSPNVHINIHPQMQSDEFMCATFKLIADHIREHYEDLEF